VEQTGFFKNVRKVLACHTPVLGSHIYSAEVNAMIATKGWLSLASISTFMEKL
jgi:hypothetical protein